MQRGSILNSLDSQRVPDTIGLTLADALTLPPELGDLLRWMTRQKELTLSEVTTFTGEPEQVTQAMLNTLIEQGFVQEILTGRETLYRAHLAAKRGRELTENIWQSLTPGDSPLSVVRNPSGVPSVTAGTSIDLYVTVNNDGNQSALFDVYIDETCQPVHQWCENPFECLTLGPQQSGEVVFHFQVPLQALPNLYDYLLIVDTPEHYREHTPIQFSHQLRVLPPVQESVQVHDPTFSLQPATTSDQPYPLQPGQILEVMITVQNRSDRVDQFRVTCSDLPPDWFTLRYPGGLNTPGIVVASKSLDLNPGEMAQVLMLLHPPATALAGDYFPTIQLHSANHPELNLLDVLYLKILPSYFLTTEIHTRIGRVKQGAGKYEIRLANEGNTPRAIALSVLNQEEEDVCRYTLDTTSLVVPPKTAATVGLQVQPRPWWRRPCYGGGRLLSFAIEVQDVDQYPVQPPPPGTLVWEPRPWWQALLVALTSLGAIAALILAIWWVFFRPAPTPRVLEFLPEDAQYQASDGNFVRLNWEVSNPDQLAALRITSKAPDGSALGQPVTYDFSQGIPEPLRDVCDIQQVLVCRNVQTDARRAGDYVFELALISKRSEGEVIHASTSDTVRITSEQPRIAFLRINGQNAPSTKYLVAIAPNRPPEPLTLSWQVVGGNDVKVELLPAPGVVRPSGQISYPLTQQPSTTTLTLKVTSATGQETSRAVVIETYTPPPTPSPLPVSGRITPLPPPPNVLSTVPLPSAASTPMPPSVVIPSTTDSASAANFGNQPNGGSADLAAPVPSATPPATPDPNAPAPYDPDELSPSELPPQFN